MDDFDNITCEEFYGYDYAEELQEILEEAANFQLQEIADEQAAGRVEVEYDFLYFGA